MGVERDVKKISALHHNELADAQWHARNDERVRQDIYANRSFKQKAKDFGEALAGIPPERRIVDYEGIAK